MTASQKHDLLEAVCHAVEERLEALAIQHCNGTISDETFIAAVLEIEAKDVTPQGLTLTASHTRDRWIVFQIKMNGTNEICAAFEFLPESGEFRRRNSPCEVGVNRPVNFPFFRTTRHPIFLYNLHPAAVEPTPPAS